MTIHTLRADQAAEIAHNGQKRETGEDFICHPRRVMAMLREYGLPEYVLIAGLLHDCVEDGHMSLVFIQHQFGEDVRDLVEKLSKREGEPHENYYRRVNCPYSIIIKLCDLVDNLSTNGHWEEERKKRFSDRAVAFVAGVGAQKEKMDKRQIEIVVELIEQIKKLI